MNLEAHQPDDAQRRPPPPSGVAGVSALFYGARVKIAAGVVVCGLVLAGCGSTSTQPAASSSAATSSAATTSRPTPTTSVTLSEPTGIAGTPSQPGSRDVALWWPKVQPTFDLIAADIAAVNDPDGFKALAACATLKTHVDQVAGLPAAPFAELAADVTAMVDIYSAFSYACLNTPDAPTRQQLLDTGNARQAAVRATVTELS